MAYKDGDFFQAYCLAMGIAEPDQNLADALMARSISAWDMQFHPVRFLAENEIREYNGPAVASNGGYWITEADGFYPLADLPTYVRFENDAGERIPLTHNVDYWLRRATPGRGPVRSIRLNQRSPDGYRLFVQGLHGLVATVPDAVNQAIVDYALELYKESLATKAEFENGGRSVTKLKQGPVEITYAAGSATTAKASLETLAGAYR